MRISLRYYVFLILPRRRIYTINQAIKRGARCARKFSAVAVAESNQGKSGDRGINPLKDVDGLHPKMSENFGGESVS